MNRRGFLAGLCGSVAVVAIAPTALSREALKADIVELLRVRMERAMLLLSQNISDEIWLKGSGSRDAFKGLASLVSDAKAAELMTISVEPGARYEYVPFRA